MVLWGPLLFRVFLESLDDSETWGLVMAQWQLGARHDGRAEKQSSRGWVLNPVWPNEQKGLFSDVL